MTANILVNELAELRQRYVGREIVFLDDTLGRSTDLKAGKRYIVKNIDNYVGTHIPCLIIDTEAGNNKAISLLWVEHSGYSQHNTKPCIRVTPQALLCGDCEGIASENDYLCRLCRDNATA